MKTVEKQITKEGLTLLAALPEKCFSGERIDLVITIRNRRKDKVVYGCCTPPRDFNMVVLDPKGKSVSLTEFGKVMLPRDKKGVFKLERIELPPGKEDRVTINIARVFDLTIGEGIYTIHLSREIKLNEDNLDKPRWIKLELKVPLMVSEPTNKRSEGRAFYRRPVAVAHHLHGRLSATKRLCP